MRLIGLGVGMVELLHNCPADSQSGTVDARWSTSLRPWSGIMTELTGSTCKMNSSQSDCSETIKVKNKRDRGNGGKFSWRAPLDWLS